MLPAPTTIVAAEQRLLDRDPAPAQRGVQMGAVEAPGRTARGRGRPAAWPPAPRSADGDQTTAPKRRGSVRRSVPCAGDEVEVVVRPGLGTALGEGERSRHAEVHQQRRRRSSGSQRYLPRRVDRADGLADESSRRDAERPAQRLADAHRGDARAAMRSAKLRRVTSTSGSSGMSGRGIITSSDRNRDQGRFADAPAGAAHRRCAARIVFAKESSMPALRFAPAARRRPVLRWPLRRVARAGARAARVPQAPARPTRSITRASTRPCSTSCCSARSSCATATRARPTRCMLDAARRTSDEQLFRRATDIALQARAGDQALAAVRAWREARARLGRGAALPGPVAGRAESHRRGRRAARRRCCARRRAAERPALIAALPRFLGRGTDRAATAALLEQALQPYADAPDTRRRRRSSPSAAAGSPRPTGRRRSPTRRRAHDARTRRADGPALLALDMLPATPEAEAIVKAQLAATPADAGGCACSTCAPWPARSATPRRPAQLERPDAERAEPGAAVADARRAELELQAAAARRRRRCRTTCAWSKAARRSTRRAGRRARRSTTTATTTPPATPAQALTQAWLLLAQAAEQQRRLRRPPSAGWRKIDNPQRALEVQARRASMLARQGKIDEARELIRRAARADRRTMRAPSCSPRAQLLRDAQALGRGRRGAGAGEQAVPGRRRPALRAGHDGREARTASTRWSGCCAA